MWVCLKLPRLESPKTEVWQDAPNNFLSLLMIWLAESEGTMQNREAVYRLRKFLHFIVELSFPWCRNWIAWAKIVVCVTLEYVERDSPELASISLLPSCMWGAKVHITGEGFFQSLWLFLLDLERVREGFACHLAWRKAAGLNGEWGWMGKPWDLKLC